MFIGGAGFDTLTGGEGSDSFVFDSRASHDRIRDFSSDDDTIGINGSVFTGLGNGELQSDDFFVGSAPVPQGSDAAILFDTATDRLYYDSNGAGAGGRVLLAQFDSGRPSTDDISII